MRVMVSRRLAAQYPRASIPLSDLFTALLPWLLPLKGESPPLCGVAVPRLWSYGFSGSSQRRSREVMPDQQKPSRRWVLKGLATGSSAPLLGPLSSCVAEPVVQQPGPPRIIEHQQLVMPDGIRLSARLWVPAGAERDPVPLVLEYIPYRKRDLYRQIDDFFGALLSTAGIGFARVDVRGSGDSEGLLRDEYTEQELSDGESVIGQLAALPWCNGSVGLRGLSWGAINALLLAARRPQALAAVPAMAGTDDRSRDDAHFLGGINGKPNLDWGLTFRLVAAAPPDPAVYGASWQTAWQARLSAAESVMARWLDRRARIPEWRAERLDPRAIEVPVLLVPACGDRAACAATLCVAPDRRGTRALAVPGRNGSRFCRVARTCMGHRRTPVRLGPGLLMNTGMMARC